MDERANDRKETWGSRDYLRVWLALLAVGVTIVLGVNCFLAQGGPTAPSVSMVRVYPSGIVAGSPALDIFVSTQVYSWQPPNTIDELGTKMIYSVWEDRTALALNQSTPLDIVASRGNLFTMGTNLLVALLTCQGVHCTSPGNITVEARAEVITYPADYLSPPTAVVFLRPSAEGHAVPAIHLTPEAPTTGPPSQGLYLWNAFGSITAAGVIDTGIASYLLMATGHIPPRRAGVAFLFACAVLAIEFVAWVVP
jgi:hypothetical protein